MVQWLESARTAFEEALRLNPADSPSLHQLAEVLDRLPNADPQRALAVRRQLLRSIPASPPHTTSCPRSRRPKG